MTFSTEGSSLDTVLYVRATECATPGSAAECNDNTVGTTSEVTVAAPVQEWINAKYVAAQQEGRV